jgi:hypothetical protein
MRPLLVVLLVLCLLAAGCGGAARDSARPAGATPAAVTTTVPPTTTSSSAVPPIDPAPPIQFSATNLDGFTAVVRHALPGPGAHLPYRLALPAVAHTPAAVFVSNPDTLPKPRVIAQYPSSSPFGTFWIQQDNPPDVDQSFIESVAANCISCDDHRLVQVAPGIEGALLAGPYGPTSVTWLENGLLFVVIGPQETFSSKLAIAIARATAAAQTAF